MSDDNFIARWSRLKRQTGAQKEKRADQPATALVPERPGVPDSTEVADEKLGAEGHKGAEPEFDLSSLPPIEEITAGTDIRAFLQSGVPAELTKAALRRAWTADPAIRDFIGLAENQWDFTDPSSIPGFGPLGPADDVRQLVAGAMGRLDELAAATNPIPRDAPQHAEGNSVPGSFEPEAPAQAAAGQQEKQQPTASHTEVEQQEDASPAASHPVDTPLEPLTIRKSRNHGGALPQ